MKCITDIIPHCCHVKKNPVTVIVTFLTSGKIVANRTVDFEQVQWLNFTIRAQDHGTPPRIAELPVFLRIVDVNDNNPIFLQPSYQVLSNVVMHNLHSPNQNYHVLLE